MASRPRRTTGARIALGVGVLMILGGLGMLGYVGWQFYGTDYVSKGQQRAITKTLQAQWQQEEDGTQLEQLQPKFVPQGKASAIIRIPAFGKKYAVPVLEGVGTDVLAKGYGHFPKSADPGEVGNYALAAHRVTHGEPLRRMPELRPGDQVIVETVDATYTYELDTDPNKLVIPFTGVWVLAPLPKNPTAGGVQPAQGKGQRLITLTTCSELFHTDDRMIAFGHLVQTTPKATAKARG